MTDIDTTEFFLEACARLNYATEELTKRVWRVTVPEPEVPLFGEERVFEVTDLAVRSEHLDAAFIDRQSFIVQRICEAVQRETLPITSFISDTGLSDGASLLGVFWVKSSVAAVDTTQRIERIGIDLEKNEVVADEVTTAFLSGLKRYKRIVATEDAVMFACDAAIEEARARVAHLVSEKYADMRRELINEASRVEAYYNAMKQESELATRSAGKTKGLLKDLANEEAELLEGLKKKYSKASMMVTLEAIGLALVKSSALPVALEDEL